MATIFGTILQGINRSSDEKLNILTINDSEKLQSELCRTGHNLYLLKAKGARSWNTGIRNMPDNCKEIDQEKLNSINFDLILCQDRIRHYEILGEFSVKFACPMLGVDYSLPTPDVNQFQIQAFADRIYDNSVSCSKFVAQGWGLDVKDVNVLPKSVDTDFFKGWIGGDNRVLTNVDFYHNRNMVTGFTIFDKISASKKFKMNPVGNSPGFSSQTKNQDELLSVYNKASVFLNTSSWLSMPYELIEAMSCGCPVVTTKTTDIVDIIKNGENGFVTNDIGEMISYIDGLLKDHNLAKSIGEKGRSTILEMCNPDWNKQLHNTIDRVPVLIVS